MLTCILGFCLLYIIFGFIGLTLKIAFHIFKWIFVAALAIGAVIATIAFAIPIMIIIPIAILLYAILCQAAEIF